MGDKESLRPITGNNYSDIASQLSTALDIPEQLELDTHKDIILVNLYLQQRLRRTTIYDVNWSLSHSSVFAALRGVFTRKKVYQLVGREQQERQDLQASEAFLRTYIERHYPTDVERHRARTIELAVNDLFARITPHGQVESMSQFVFDPEVLQGWNAERWRQELQQTNP